MASAANRFPWMALSTDVETALKNRAAALFAALCVSDIQLIADEDHDGDPILRMTVTHDFMSDPVVLADVRAKDSELRDLVWELKDSRFLHIRHIYDEKQAVSMTDE
jgi:hypothetical protein